MVNFVFLDDVVTNCILLSLKVLNDFVGPRHVVEQIMINELVLQTLVFHSVQAVELFGEFFLVIFQQH